MNPVFHISEDGSEIHFSKYVRFCYASHVFIQYFSLPNTHIVYLYSAISYSIIVIYISVPVCTLCERGQNIDEKYDQCILYFILDLVTYWVLSQISCCKQTCVNELPSFYDM